MDITISLSANAPLYAKGWYEEQTDNANDLLDHISSKAYSNAIFEKGKNRSIKTVTGFHRLLILDIDNDKTNFSLNDCKTLFEKNKVASLIVPSRSHNKEKNGIIRDRYRIICFFDKTIPFDIEKKDYKYMMELIVKDLEMEALVDNKALFDKSRLYYPTINLDRSLVCKTHGKEINLNHYLEKVKIHNTEESIKEEIKKSQKKAKIVKKPKLNPKTTTNPIIVKDHTAQTVATSEDELFIYHKIYKYDLAAIYKEINFIDLINKYETIVFEEINDKGVKIKTESKNTYQFFDDTSVLYDFKNEVSFTIYSYIRNFHNCTNIEVLNYMREFADVDRYRTVNEIWQRALSQSFEISMNIKELQSNLITALNFDKITIKRYQEDYIVVNGTKFHISEFGLDAYKSKYEIIQKFQSNRVKKGDKNKK